MERSSSELAMSVGFQLTGCDAHAE